MPLSLPAPHLLIRDFLSPQDHAALLDYATASEPRYVEAMVNSGQFSPDARRCEKLDDLGPFDAMLRARIETNYKDWLQQLRISAFELGKLRLQIAAYGDKAHFAFHLDTSSNPESPASRRMLTGVYYFFREPKQFSGGEIRLYHLAARPPDGEYVAVTPQQNTLLLFPSWVGHQVDPVQLATGDFADRRFAVNCWLSRPKVS